MTAAGLLGLALIWRAPGTDRTRRGRACRRWAAALVAGGVLGGLEQSAQSQPARYQRPTCRSRAAGCWAAGDLITAAVLPIVMIVGRVLEERSLLGSREAIGALARLMQSDPSASARKASARPCRRRRYVSVTVLRCRQAIAYRVDGVIRSGHASVDVASLTGEPVPLTPDPATLSWRARSTSMGSWSWRWSRRRRHHARPHHRLDAPGGGRQAAGDKAAGSLCGRYLLLVLLVAAGVWFATSDTAAMLAVLVASCPCALVLAARQRQWRRSSWPPGTVS